MQITPIYAVLIVLSVQLSGCDRTQSVPVPESRSDVRMLRTMANYDFPEWAAELRRRAEQGDADAQYQIGEKWRQVNFDKFVKGAIPFGNAYLDEPNLSKSAEWFQKAAMLGHPKAQYQLGLYHQFGIGVEKDGLKAVDWYQKSAAQDNIEAMANLGEIYFAGGLGVPKNTSIAIRWYLKAAERGDEQSAYRLFILYSEGIEVQRDNRTAMYWLGKVAAQGIADAQQAMGSIYAGNDGELFPRTSFPVEPDNVLSYAWLNLAASRVDSDKDSSAALALKQRDAIRRRLSAGELVEAERLSSSWKIGEILVREQSSKGMTKNR